jgi:hypothetical protein
MYVVNRLVPVFFLFSLLACSSDDGLECTQNSDCGESEFCDLTHNRCWWNCDCMGSEQCYGKCCGYVCEGCLIEPYWCPNACPEAMVCNEETCDCVSNKTIGMICPDGDSNCPIEFPVCLEDVGPSGYCTKPCKDAGDCGWSPWCCEDHGQGFFCWDVDDCEEEK